jgi:PAS domain S-box-containing protein
MATKVVTFRLPDELMEAITSQAQATGRPRTAVVVDALKQVFGVPSAQTLPTSVDKLHQHQEAVGQAVASLKRQPIELRRGTASYHNQCHQEELDQSLATAQSLFDEVSSTPPKASQSQECGVVVDVTDTHKDVNPEMEQHSGSPNDYQETVQQLAAKVEQRARMLEQVLSASVDHVCMYDRLGRYTYANRAFMQSFQLERTELYGKTWQQVGLPVEAMRAFEVKLQITLATGQSIAEEISLPTVNGVRDYEYILSPIHSTDGGIEAVVYTARDITERKLAEEALRESEKNYRNLFEWAHDSIFITDSSTQILLDVNEHAARRLGYTRKQLLALPAEEYSPPMELKHRETVLRQLWQTGHVVFEHVHNCKNGKQMPVEISSRVIEYGGQLAIQSFVRDITVRKQAEEKLDLYRKIVNRAKDAIAILDLQGRYVAQNPAHRSLLGYSDEELLGRTVAYHLEAEGYSCLMKELIKKGNYCGEVTSRSNSGELVTLQLDASVLQNESGQAVWYLIFPRPKQTPKLIDEPACS